MIRINERLGQDIPLYSCRLDAVTVRKLKDFSCGNDTLDTFFREKAVSSEQEVTYIFIDTEKDRVAAAASIACSAIEIGDGQRITSSVPAVEITYFAVDKRYQKLPYSEEKEAGYFSDLIMDSVLQIICDFSLHICGATHVLLYATPDAVHFYERNRFVQSDIAWVMPRGNWYLDGCTLMYQGL